MKMKLLRLVMLIFLAPTFAMAQKKVIDQQACDDWVSLQEVNGKGTIISNDGQYVVYRYGSKSNGSTLVLKNINNNWESKYPGASNPVITPDNRMFIVMLPGDSLMMMNLQGKDRQYITGIQSYYLPNNGNGRWLTYIKMGAKDELALKDLLTGKQQAFQGAENSWFNDQGTALLIKRLDGLTVINLETGKDQLIPNSSNVTEVSFDPSGNKIAFMSKDKNGYNLLYYKIGMQSPQLLATDRSSGLKKGFILTEGPLSFSKNGKMVFFPLKKAETVGEPAAQAPVITKAVTVWSYRDKDLQEKQINDLGKLNNRTYAAVTGISTGSPVQLEDEELQLEYGEYGQHYGDKFGLLTTRVSGDEFYWNKESKALYVVDLRDGKIKKIIQSTYPGCIFPDLPPNESFVTWFDGNSKHYFSYELKTGTVRNISELIKEPLGIIQRGQADKIAPRGRPFGVPFWINKSKALLVYDQHDIWQLDPFGRTRPVNLTNGYGKRQKIRFRLIENENSPVCFNNRELLICGLNELNKENGFWKLDFNHGKDPARFVMDSHAYYFEPNGDIHSPASGDPVKFSPNKAKDADVFIIRRMSSEEAPNLFFTKNFKSYTAITEINPQKDYNWYKSELITWTLPDGLKCDGIMHKPENFDPTKKYPVIFNYYERRSENLNGCRTPELSGHNINIPWFVSRGYLVFEPDMYYKTGKTAQSIIDVAESAAKYLGKLGYVDTGKMGCQGQSFGGYETNVLATGTHLFKAACEMAGPTDIISEYGSIRPGGLNNELGPDIGQRNLAVFPWEHPEVFIENSPVFHIGKMTTPLLIVHNRKDGAILYPQAIELYLGMRRAGKKVWMLEYDGEDHAIYDEKNKLDFTIRMQQFFDHYLKGAPSPKWILDGVPAKLKGIESGLELDTAGREPGPGITEDDKTKDK
jgi:dipeptidyl aminopeptidase/acylaminoacyl peptidase